MQSYRSNIRLISDGEYHPAGWRGLAWAMTATISSDYLDAVIALPMCKTKGDRLKCKTIISDFKDFIYTDIYTGCLNDPEFFTDYIFRKVAEINEHASDDDRRYAMARIRNTVRLSIVDSKYAGRETNFHHK